MMSMFCIGKTEGHAQGQIIRLKLAELQNQRVAVLQKGTEPKHAKSNDMSGIGQEGTPSWQTPHSELSVVGHSGYSGGTTAWGHPCVRRRYSQAGCAFFF